VSRRHVRDYNDDMSDRRQLEPRRLILGFLALLVLFVLGGVVYTALFVSEADKVRRALGELMDAADHRSPRGVTEMLTDDFTVTWRSARVTKTEVHQALVRLFMVDYKHGFQVEVSPKVVPVKVSEDETSAVVRFTITAKGKPNPGGEYVKLGQREAQGGVTFVMTWARTDDGWKAKHLTFELPKPAAAKTGG